jgi:hypothetical protein
MLINISHAPPFLTELFFAGSRSVGHSLSNRRGVETERKTANNLGCSDSPRTRFFIDAYG